MIAKDKFGRNIFPKPYSEMTDFGNILLKNSYNKSRNKPNLFYKKFSEGLFFADMRGTEEVPIWEDTRPLFYWKFESNIPNWKARRLIKNELIKLYKQNCFCRLSFDWSMHIREDPIFESVSSTYIDEENAIFDWDDGYCRICKKDFQDDGEFCSKECEEKYYDAMKKPCAVCGEKIELFEEVSHHVSYFPEKTIFVHRSCHNLIHKTDKYPKLKPSKEDIDKFYKNE